MPPLPPPDVPPPLIRSVEVLDEDAAPDGEPLYVLRTARETIVRPCFGSMEVVHAGRCVTVTMRAPTVSRTVTVDEFRVVGGRLEFVGQAER